MPITTAGKQAASLLLLGLITALSAVGQTETASISGVVTGKDGTPLAGVKAIVTSRATGASRISVTAADGRYSQELLSPGTYEVDAEAEGYKRFINDAVLLQVAKTSQLNIKLETGSDTEWVIVAASTSMLTTDSASFGTVVGMEKILSLPLNGRQFIQLALLAPLANGGGRAVQQNIIRLGQTGSISSSGGRTNNNAFLLDGATNIDPDYNAISYVPILDTISEFQVQGAQYSVQYGRASGSQINVATRQGSNQWHGSAWEFLRNQVFDSRPFNSVTSNLARNQRNQYGGTIGGRILKDRLFFFGGVESLKLRQAGVGITTVAVPTAAERNGNFSASGVGIYDPDSAAGSGSSLVRTKFPNNIIPVSRLNPQVVAAMSVMPLPNVSASNFVNNSEVLQQDSRNYTGRLDFIASDSMSVYGRYSLYNESNRIPDAVPDRDRLGAVRPQNLAIGASKVMNNGKVNEFKLGFNRLRFQDGLPEPEFTVGGHQTNLPRFLPSGYAIMGGAGAYTGTQGGGGVLTRNNTYQAYDNFSWRRGRHALKIGVEALRVEYNVSVRATPWFSNRQESD